MSGWVSGNHAALRFPAHADALRSGGAAFLTDAFRAWGALGADNAVTALTACEEVSGGSTGRKLELSLEYARPSALPTELFVKFSRDFDDPVRDRGRTQMESEVRFAALSRSPGFPIPVPTTLFADYERESGTGILITERITYGCNGIERRYAKCTDYAMPEPVEHYRALVTALATLAGAHKAGRLPEHVTAAFPVDLTAASVGEPPPLTPERIERQLERYRQFATAYPSLLPANVRSPAFADRLSSEVFEVACHADEIWQFLAHQPSLIALCHWNANVDNAWFWRDRDDQLRCGLLDWGCVSQLNVAMAIWGALCSAEIRLWDDHLDELLALFVTKYWGSGGPALAAAEIKDHIVLYAVLMGITWLLDVPAYLRSRLPVTVTDRQHPLIAADEPVRARLQMFTNFLNVWESHDVCALLDRISRVRI